MVASRMPRIASHGHSTLTAISRAVRTTSRPSHAVTASAAAFHSSSTSSLPNDGQQSTKLQEGLSDLKSTSTDAASSSSSSISSSHRSDTDNDADSAMAFGGGASSRGGPSPAPSLEDVSHADIFIRARPSSTLHHGPSSTKSSYPPSNSTMISGSAGKGAVPGYGKRKVNLPDATRTSTRKRDEEIARGYEHTYAPTSRSQVALPRHTYFSNSSTSFNAAASAPSPSTSHSGHLHATLKPKKTALIFPGQGSQYVGMCRDIYRSFRSARSVWHLAEEALITPVNPSSSSMADPHHNSFDESSMLSRRHSSLGYIPGSGHDRAESEEQRRAFEEELAKSHIWDEKRSRRGRRGWLRDAVFFGDQLDLTRAENAQPAILVATLSILAVLRKEFSLDLVKSKVSFAAGHGSGTYAALVGSGALDMIDAVRLMRHRGLISSQHLANHPILFPEGCKRPDSIYETWAFANAGSGKGAELLEMDEDLALNVGGVPPTSATTDGQVAANESHYQQSQQDPSSLKPKRRGWKRTQMSGVMVRPGMLPSVLEEVAQVQSEIASSQIAGVSNDEVVEVSNINSALQVVLSGTRVGVSVACERLRMKNLGARAVNLPVSGPYHSSLMVGAVLGPALENLPLRDPDPRLRLVSSVDGSLLSTAQAVRSDLRGALHKPVRWLDAVDRLRKEGVERFVCLGPGRACAHLLSKELGYRDKIEREKRRRRLANTSSSSTADGDDGQPEKEYEVWSVATVEDIETLSNVLSRIQIGGAQSDVLEFSSESYLGAGGAGAGGALEQQTTTTTTTTTGHGGRREGGVDRGTLAV